MRFVLVLLLLVLLLPREVFAQFPLYELPETYKSYFYSRASIGHTWSLLNKSPKEIQKARIQTVNLSYSTKSESIKEIYNRKGKILSREVGGYHEHSPFTETYEYDKRGRLKKVIIYSTVSFFEGGSAARDLQYIYSYNLLGKPSKVTTKTSFSDTTPDNIYIRYNLRLKPRAFRSYVTTDDGEEHWIEQNIYQYNWRGQLKAILTSNEKKKPVPRILRDPNYYRTELDKNYYGERWRKADWQELFYKDLYFDNAFVYKRGRLQKAYWFASKVVTDSFVYKNGRLQEKYLKADLSNYKDEQYRFEYNDSGKLSRMICNNGAEIITFDKTGFPQTVTRMKDGVEAISAEIVYTFYEDGK